MLKAKRLMAVVLVLAMLVTMASFPVSAADYVTAKLEGLNASNVAYSGAGLRNAAKQNMDTLFDGDLTRTPSTAAAINGIQFNWTGSATKKTIEVTLNEVATIAKLKLYWGNSDYNALPAQTYNVYFAGEDGTYGAAAYSHPDDGLASPNGKSRDDVVTFETPVENVKSIKIEITSHYKSGDPALREMEIYVALPAIPYTIKYVDVNGNPLKDASTGVGLEGDTINVEAPHVSGYMAVGTTTRSLTLVKDAVNEVEFTYVPFEKMTAFPDNITPFATIASRSGVDEVVDKNTGIPTRPVENILDGDETTVAATGWTSSPNMNIVIDLGEVYDLDNIVLNWATNTSTGMNWGVAGGAHRANRYTVSVSNDGETYETLYTYDDTARLEAKDTINAGNAETALTGRYVKIVADRTFASGRIALRDISFYAYTATDRVVSAPDYQYYATGSTFVNFPITVTTLDNTMPSYFDAANWALENCTIDSVTVEDISNPASMYSTWAINVKAIPDATADYFALDLVLPSSYTFDDKISFRREASDLLFDSAIADGDNAILLDKTDLVLNYKEDGTLTDASAKVENRKITMMLQVQSVIADGLPYEGYDEIVIELKEFRSKGDRVRYYLDEFVRSGDCYLASLLVTKAGVDQLEAVIGIYGVEADGTKVELDTRTITSDLINVEAKYPVAKTQAQTLSDYTFPMDVLDQLIGYVHPADLPTYSNDEWKFFKEILVARGWKTDEDPKKDAAQIEINRVKTLLENELALLEDPNWVPTKDYADGSVTIENRRTKPNTPGTYERVIRMGTEVWNLMTSLHVDSFSVHGPINRPTADQAITGFENDIVDAYITFREGIDYEYGNKFTEGNGFCIRMKFVGASAEYTNVTLGNAYNSVRRALNDDQVSPILFRLDWYNWAKNPFEGGVITVQITDSWAENYGLYNLAVYHMSGYKYSEDNDATLELMEDGVCITNPAVKEVSVVIEGAQKMYDTYAIVGTEKIPSDEPEVNGTYFDVD